MNEKTKRRLIIAWKAAGWCLVAVSLTFIAIKAARTPVEGLAGAFSTGTAALLILFSVVYSLLNALLALAWALLYRMVGGDMPPLRFMARVHLRTGIVKYLPGNVFHLAGRHVLAGKAGAGQGAVLAANVLEMGLIATVALILAAAASGTGFLDPVVPAGFLSGAFAPVPVLVSILAVAAAAVFFLRKYRHLADRFSPGAFFPAVACYVIFFAVAALLLCGLAFRGPQSDYSAAGYFPVLGVFCISWIAGFVVPGAPGGLGIRESVIIAALSPYLGDAPALAAALLLRAVTVTGDVVSFGYSFLAPRGGDVTSPRR